MKFSIFINEAKFTADEKTIDAVIDALRKQGFRYDKTTEGFIAPGFYGETSDREYDWRNG